MSTILSNYRRRLFTSVLSQKSDNTHELVSLEIIGPNTVIGRQYQYTVEYQPSDTDETEVLWEVVEGTLYASIDQTGLLTVNSNAYNSYIKIMCTSVDRSTVFTQKNIIVTYNIPVESISISGPDSIEGIKDNEFSASVLPLNASNTTVQWSITSGTEYAIINEDTGEIAILQSANNSSVTLRAASMLDPNIYTEKTITVTFLTTYVYVDENGWEDSGTTIDGYKVYQSASNYNVASSQAKCTIHFKGYSTFTFYARSYGEANYDYLFVGEIDKNLSVTTKNNKHTATNAKQDFKGNSSTSYTTITYTNLSINTEHTFDLIYIKDSNTNSYDDRAYFYLPYRVSSSAGGSTELESIGIIGDTVVQNNYCNYIIQTSPADTLLDAVEWSIISGSEYASITRYSGKLTLNDTADNAAITIRATSVYNSTIYGTKDITGTYYKALTSLAIAGPDVVNDGSTTAQYTPIYNPEDTIQQGVNWSITSGARYADIDENTGLLTINQDAVESNVTIRVTSAQNPDIYASKIVTLTYVTPLISLQINGPDDVSDIDFENEAFYYVLYNPVNTSQLNIGWSITSGTNYASITNKGVLTVKENANNNQVIIRARSNDNPNILATKTITVTYTTSQEIPSYFSVSSLDKWQQSTVQSPTGEYIYRSTNTGTSKNEATAIITFTSLPVIVIYARSDAEAGYDYVVVGELDKTPERQDQDDYANAKWNNVYYSFITNNTTDDMDFTPIIYTNVDPTVQHTVTIKFLKDDATNRGDDRGYFYIPVNENTPQAANKLKGLSIDGPNHALLLDGSSQEYYVTYNPSYTVQTGVTWSITSGNDYAYIDPRTGELFATRYAEKSSVTIRATSIIKPTMYAEKNILVTMTDKLYILFEDSTVEQLCLQNFDSDNDGKITYEEAAAVTSIGTIFSGKAITSFDELKYFTGLTTIPSNAFKNCTSLINISLPETITTIGRSSDTTNTGVFYGCTKLETVIMGPNITLIGNYAFYNCTSCNIYLKNTVMPSASNYSFGSSSTSSSLISILFVPESAFSNYSGTTPYSTLNSNSRLKTWNP